jgi:hypothetical protein
MIAGLIIVSCQTPKKMVDEQPKNDPAKETSQTAEPANETYFLGEVQMLDCGVVIQVSSGETRHKYSPLNLDPKFQVDKLRLKLKFKELEQKGTTCSEFPAIEIKEAFAVR